MKHTTPAVPTNRTSLTPDNGQTCYGIRLLKGENGEEMDDQQGEGSTEEADEISYLLVRGGRETRPVGKKNKGK